MSKVIDVRRDFGAKGDGVADDTAAIQAAVDAAYARGGGVVYLPTASYAITSWTGANSNVPAFYAIRLKSNVTLDGNGSTLVVTGGPGVGGYGAIIGNDQTLGLTDMEIRHLAIDMSGLTAGSNPAGVLFGNPFASPTPASRIRLRSVRVADSPYIGIQLRDLCSDFSITECEIAAAGNIGIQLVGFDGYVANNKVANTGDNAVDIYGEAGVGIPTKSNNITVVGNVLIDVRAGVFFETVSHCVASGNTIIATDEGVVVNRINSEPTGNVVADNTIQSGQRGIWISGGSYETTVTGNSIRLTANSGNGIRVDGAHRSLIASNSIRGNGNTDGGIAVRYHNAAANHVCVGNYFSLIGADIAIEDTSSSIERLANYRYDVTSAAFNVYPARNVLEASLQASDGLITKTVAGAVDDGDFAFAPSDGALAVDTSSNSIYFRSGGAWHQVPGSTPDFWRSGAGGTTLPDGTTDLTESIRRNGNVGLNTDPTRALDVVGTIGLADSGGTNAFISGGNGSATGTNNVALGVNSLVGLTTGAENVALGYSALQANSGGSNNVAIGYNALLSNTTADGNIALGQNALRSNTSAANNLAIGNATLFFNNGANNTAIGVFAMFFNTSGADNVAIGNQALNHNTSGGNSVAVGNLALTDSTTASRNTAVGDESLRRNLDGANNTAVGGYSAGYNYSGDLNTAVGFDALRGNSTGDSNTAIGAEALHRNAFGSNNTAVGASAFSDFIDDTPATLSPSAINNATNDFTVVGHGLTVGSHVPLRVNSTGTVPAGLTAGGVSFFTVVDANTLNSDVDITSDGTGVVTLVPSLAVSNTTAIGYNSQPSASNQVVLGDANVTQLSLASGVVLWAFGTGTPEGAVTAPVGSIFSRTDGGTDTTIYRKTSGTGNTGWTAVTTGGFTVSDTAPATPFTGQGWYESDTGKAFVYDGTVWVEIGGVGASDPTMGGDLTGTASNAQIAANAVGPTELSDAARIWNGVIGTRVGTLSAETAGTTKTPRIYNTSGRTITISDLHASVDTAPTGSAITVVVRSYNAAGVQQTTNSITIAAAANVGTSTGLSVSVPDGHYYQIWTTAVGSTVAGTDLTVSALGVWS